MAARRTKEEQAAYMREYRARKQRERHGAGSIEAGVTGITPSPPDDDRVHARCRDTIHQLRGRIAGLEAEIEGLRAKPVMAVTEPGSMPGFEVHSVAPEGGTRGIGSTPSNTLRPAFLAAPDDDCAACGHDRHRWVQEGVCKAPVGRGICGCRAFTTREELTF